MRPGSCFWNRNRGAWMKISASLQQPPATHTHTRARKHTHTCTQTHTQSLEVLWWGWGKDSEEGKKGAWDLVVNCPYGDKFTVGYNFTTRFLQFPCLLSPPSLSPHPVLRATQEMSPLLCPLYISCLFINRFQCKSSRAWSKTVHHWKRKNTAAHLDKLLQTLASLKGLQMDFFQLFL